MAVDQFRVGWLGLFTQQRRPSGFLQRFFTMKPGGNFKGNKVILDIQRYGEDVAIAVKAGTGPNWNDADVYTTKEFTPTAYNEGTRFNMEDLINRPAGTDPYTAAYMNWAGEATAYMIKSFAKLDDKIQRAVELQAAQVLQTGKLDLTDADGETRYELDFKPKVTHFPQTAISWSSSSSVKEADLLSLANVISADGQAQPDILIMGQTALVHFMDDSAIQAKLDNRRMEMGTINPQLRNSGAVFYGTYKIGTYFFELWAYNGTYKHPETGTVTRFIDDNKVVMMSSTGRLDLVSAEVPPAYATDPRVADIMPGRLTDRAAGYDLMPNVYLSENGKQIKGELETRPLCVPVQIDSFGCLNTVQP